MSHPRPHELPYQVAFGDVRAGASVGLDMDLIGEMHTWLDDQIGRDRWNWTMIGRALIIMLFTEAEATLVKLRFSEYL